MTGMLKHLSRPKRHSRPNWYMVVTLLSLIAILGIAACRAAPTPTPAPTPTARVVVVTPTPLPTPTKAPPPKEVKIGVLLPFSGASAPVAESIRWGMEIAGDEINEAGGIKSLGGAKLTFLWRDHASSPDTSAAEAEKLATVDKVNVMMVGYLVAYSMPATAVAERYKIPMVVISTADRKMGEQGWKYMFMPMPVGAENWYVRPVFGTVETMNKVSPVKVKKWALVAVNNEVGRDVAKGYAAEIAAGKYESVLSDIIPADITEFGPVASKLKASGADAYFVNVFGAQGLGVIRALAEQRVNPVVLAMPGGGSAPGFKDLDISHSVYVPSPVAIGREPETVALAEKFKKRFGRDIDVYALSNYPFPYLVKDALERAGTVESTALRDALAATDMKGGPLNVLTYKGMKFDARGLNTYASAANRQIIDHQEILVWPDEIKFRDPIWPGEWKWPK